MFLPNPQPLVASSVEARTELFDKLTLLVQKVKMDRERDLDEMMNRKGETPKEGVIL